MDQGSKLYKGTPAVTPTGGAGGQLKMKAAIDRRLATRRSTASTGGLRSGEPGGGPSGGKVSLAPSNTGLAGSLIKKSGQKKIISPVISPWGKKGATTRPARPS